VAQYYLNDGAVGWRAASPGALPMAPVIFDARPLRPREPQDVSNARVPRATNLYHKARLRTQQQREVAQLCCAGRGAVGVRSDPSRRGRVAPLRCAAPYSSAGGVAAGVVGGAGDFARDYGGGGHVGSDRRAQLLSPQVGGDPLARSGPAAVESLDAAAGDGARYRRCPQLALPTMLTADRRDGVPLPISWWSRGHVEHYRSNSHEQSRALRREHSGRRGVARCVITRAVTARPRPLLVSIKIAWHKFASDGMLHPNAWAMNRNAS